MNAFAPRRSTEPQISLAITLGWRIATLYSLRAGELPSSPPDGLLPMRRSLPARERLALELRAAVGDADRLGVPLSPAAVGGLLDLAEHSPDSPADEERFHEKLREWHIHLATMLWADHEATGKAYELGSFLSDTSNRVVRKLRGRDDARDPVTRELRRVFKRERVERIKRLLDDLQARIDPAAVRIVKQHLDVWQAAVGEREPSRATRAGLEGLDNQTVIWFQLVTGDKEPEAFIGHEDRARVRETMIARTLRTYRRRWKTMTAAIVALAAAAAGLYLLVDSANSNAVTGSLVASITSIVGALGVKLTSLGLTVRKSLDARAELLWNTALVDVISRKTLRVDDVLTPLPARRCARVAARRRGSHADTGARGARVADRAVAASAPARERARHAAGWARHAG
jgi:hypothetical protein